MSSFIYISFWIVVSDLKNGTLDLNGETQTER